MKYFLDTEFIEDGKTIDLISIGIVCEDGREYYAINRDCDLSKASQWVRDNVISQLPEKDPIPGNVSSGQWDRSLAWKTKEQITIDVCVFLKNLAVGGGFPPMKKTGKWSSEAKEIFAFDGLEQPEIWAYYADYDWVVFCQLFGTMMDLPKGFPMYCRDIKQECDRLGNPKLPPNDGEHDALADAKWNKLAWEFLQGYSQKLFPDHE